MKIGTFNVLNLALPGVTFYGDERYTPAEYDDKKRWLVAQLGRMGADIVGFQEIWNEAALQDVCVAAGYEHVVVPGADDLAPILERGPFVGLASRFPMVVTSIVDFPADVDKVVDGVGLVRRAFSRPVLKARLELAPGSFVTVFVVHLKSKGPIVDPNAKPDDPHEDVLGKARALIRRASEAAALRFLVLETVTGTREPVVVLGDLNDGVNAVTTEMVTGSRPFRFWDRARKEPIWDRLLYSAWELHAARATKDVSFTHLYNGLYDNLDHILVSEEFVSDNPDHVGTLVDLRYFNDHLIDSTLTDPQKSRTVSDHGQLVAEIRMKTKT